MKVKYLITLFLLLTPLILCAEDNEICFSCHGQKIEGIPLVNMKEFGQSIHGKNLCISCHEDAKEIPHPSKLSPVSCSICHRIETQIYLQSDHGRALSRGVSVAATCTSCHGKTHTLLSSRDERSPVHRKNIPQTCAVCHASKEKMSEVRLTEREPFDTYLHSVHGQAFKEGKLDAAVCSDCHGTHDLHAASNSQSKIFRANVPNTCGRCHENVYKVYERSIHGKAMKAGIKEAPVCTDCHGEHTIRAVKDPSSSVWSGAITKTCANCHSSEKIVTKFGLPADRLKTFQDSYHGLASRAGSLQVANCASCHGWHDILPSNDTESSVHPKNLHQTCGKCHPGAQSKLIQGKIHGGKKAELFFLIHWVKMFYLILIPLTIGFMFIHNFSDYLRKMITQGMFSTGSNKSLPNSSIEVEMSFHVERLNFNERIQHLFLLVTFIVLAYSGFVLKYPEAWWAKPFQFVDGENLRKGIHRWTALIFIVTSIYHLFYMVITRRGRFLLKYKLFPKIQDAIDPTKLILYNLGIAKDKPKLHYPSYIERMEYWALLWGSMIMILTGSLLVFNDYTLKYFPLWASELATLIHFYEAILATLSILVWHFYWTIFDPEVYPMNMAWIIGRARNERRKQ